MFGVSDERVLARTLVCLSRRFRDRFSTGVYWITANALQGNARDTFTHFFAEVFHENGIDRD